MAETIKVRTKSGKLFKLPALTPMDIIELQDEQFQVDRMRLMEDLDMGEADTEIRTRELRSLTKQRDSSELIVNAAFGVRGGIALIEKSLERAKRLGMTNIPTFDQLELDPTDSLPATALKLVGVDLERAADDQKQRELGDTTDDEVDPTDLTLTETGT